MGFAEDLKDLKTITKPQIFLAVVLLLVGLGIIMTVMESGKHPQTQNEWWFVWLLFGVGAAVVLILSVFVCASCGEGDRQGASLAKVCTVIALQIGSGLIAFVSGLAAIICLFIGVIRFVKWVCGTWHIS
jgi:hypothetical protein